MQATDTLPSHYWMASILPDHPYSLGSRPNIKPVAQSRCVAEVTLKQTDKGDRSKMLKSMLLILTLSNDTSGSLALIN
jgi:hypothetical protein